MSCSSVSVSVKGLLNVWLVQLRSEAHGQMWGAPQRKSGDGCGDSTLSSSEKCEDHFFCHGMAVKAQLKSNNHFFLKLGEPVQKAGSKQNGDMGGVSCQDVVPRGNRTQ